MQIILAVAFVLALPRDVVVTAAIAQVGVTRSYDPSYRSLRYPGGDVPLETGVCADVVIRAFRKAGIDLQVLVHEDMKRAFASYPRNWGLTRPDPNIDHRRVPNLAAFFKRSGKSLPATRHGPDYQPGDVVTWRLPSGVPHVGIVSNRRVPGTDRYLVVHNIGYGAQLEDVLFAFEVTGRYRWFLQ
jgi:uncharacterized protein YijF (DUF1287 family)